MRKVEYLQKSRIGEQIPAMMQPIKVKNHSHTVKLDKGASLAHHVINNHQ